MKKMSLWLQHIKKSSHALDTSHSTKFLTAEPPSLALIHSPTISPPQSLSYTHSHPFSHILTHTHARPYARTHTHTRAHSRTHTHAHTHSHTHMHTRTHSRTHSAVALIEYKQPEKSIGVWLSFASTLEQNWIRNIRDLLLLMKIKNTSF